MLPRIGVLALVAVCAASAADQPLTAKQRQLNIESFEKVWTTVRDTHWDPKFGGLDWQAVHDELRPKVEAATSMEQARAVMSEMLKRLQETHFGIFPAEVYEEIDTPSRGGAEKRDGTTGIDARVLSGRAVVTAVDEGSPAAKSGVKVGWEITSIDGKPLGPALKKVEDQFAKSTLLDILQSRLVLSRLDGKVGEAVSAEFLDGKDHAVKLKLDHIPPRGTMAKLGYLPPMFFWTESRKVRPDVGYVHFNMFFQPDELIKSVQDTVKACAGCKGIVIDLRGNPGGIGGLALGVASWFMDRSGEKLGTMTLRQNEIKFVVYNRPNAFLGPLAILVDGCSGSTSEILAGGLKDLKRARIFGTRSAGAALPSQFERLPNGDGFQYAIANYISEGGKPLEGLGVIPDEEVKLTRHQLLEGQDPVIEAAVSWIERQK